MLSAVLRSALAALGLLAAGCGSGSSHPSCPAQGIVWLSWTIQGQPPSASSCQAIDHLAVQLHTACGSVQIDPIPCIVGISWEYRDLPEGTATVVLDAIDARGRVTLEAVDTTRLDVTRGAMPTTLDLR
ncbi:MAG: hypothetical protein JWN44_5534 [Myxococcales bacterium]|nr:hypothetical protein [Myxococcales bacterium]